MCLGMEWRQIEIAHEVASRSELHSSLLLLERRRRYLQCGNIFHVRELRSLRGKRRTCREIGRGACLLASPTSRPLNGLPKRYFQGRYKNGNRPNQRNSSQVVVFGRLNNGIPVCHYLFRPGLLNSAVTNRNSVGDSGEINEFPSFLWLVT